MWFEIGKFIYQFSLKILIRRYLNLSFRGNTIIPGTISFIKNEDNYASLQANLKSFQPKTVHPFIVILNMIVRTVNFFFFERFGGTVFLNTIFSINFVN